MPSLTGTISSRTLTKDNIDWQQVQLFFCMFLVRLLLDNYRSPNGIRGIVAKRP
jgi:hypothetical protein